MEKTTSVSSNSWTGSTEDVTFTLTGGNNAIQVLTITYEAAIAGGPASAGLSFASSALEVGVGETVDGPALTKATTAEAVYSSSDDAVATVDAATGKVTGVAAGTATITAKTAATADFKEGEASYTVTVVDYSIPGMTIENPMTVAQALAACDESPKGVYVCGIVTEVTTPWSTQYNNVTYNIVDDGSTDVLIVFRGKWGAGVTPTADKNPEVGARVIVKGNLINYNGTDKEVNTGNEIVSYEAPGSFDGVEDIVADDANAPVEFYNLQGVRVANPENGLYIRVQGKKATKVLVR
ncbi:MAG: Ig-like domain-containing protein [Muribaculaceae bacterium]